jgi:hypothetical protein
MGNDNMGAVEYLGPMDTWGMTTWVL